ncbi:NAD(P)/FAD-dependent oxidoreductase [Paraburkholderia silviterrae]|uniref:NAD(P)/FAD-dependent oxidoreductase n=1 Tax=Paraburkholderia silviterrae TaxID=2528715 RepID=A0A4R5M7I4_9BURK|nr:NAD(P)/FAD-dependent oxidoreductase [Paraburkholderia silviterrae]TDG22160.1 NAD(P)/FAD-dependent oxidoreductase [Paraburkholderia silviterrae]
MAPIPDFPSKARAADAARILIVGGGAGGLQLATRLGSTLGRRGLAQIVLVDRLPTHFWKPLLHEAASGHRDPASHTIEYAAQAKRHGFEFVQGELRAVDRARRIATIGAVVDQDGTQIVPQREMDYHDLVLAVGSVTNFFNVPGAARHALPLEHVGHAEDFRKKFLAACAKVNHLADAPAALPTALPAIQPPTQPARPVCINVIGAGATGVELAAALRHAVGQLAAYRFRALDPERDVRIRLIEGAPRVLPVLDPRISGRTQAQLERLHVEVLTGTRVARVEEEAIVTSSGERLPADMTIWAAGVAGPAMLRSIDGLALSASNQVIVTDTLQTPDDPHMFAFGDCAACPSGTSSAYLPPRAQVAHQQAVYLSQAFAQRLAGKPVAGFVFRDAGTVVSLGQSGALYQADLRVSARAVIVDGPAAAGLYRLLYRKHLSGVHGIGRTLLQTLGQLLHSYGRPSIKLH